MRQEQKESRKKERKAEMKRLKDLQRLSEDPAHFPATNFTEDYLYDWASDEANDLDAAWSSPAASDKLPRQRSSGGGARRRRSEKDLHSSTGGGTLGLLDWLNTAPSPNKALYQTTQCIHCNLFFYDTVPPHP